MEYIWESILDRDTDIRFKQAENFSPYSEVIEENKVGDQKQIEYNCLLRYDQIFDEMLMLKQKEGEWTDSFFDVCSHLLIKVDSVSGLSKNEFYIRRLMKNISEGVWLENITDTYNQLSDRKKYEVASYYVTQEKIGESVLLYAKAVTAILETGVVYKNTIEPKVLLVYLGEKMSQEMQYLWKVLNYLFLPLSYQARLFEQSHIAIEDEEQTLHYERIELF